ncbi:MAG TPA: ribosome small subunit-dependent GTPase A [Candidatus Onthoplasma faecigallinarum]|nr:ribosome small subunit-dependent GTPase A [Candidatus Onthoplasma faecigallinarum]
MAHLESYDSFKTKKSIDKKNRAKDIALNKKVDDNFVIRRDSSLNTGIVIETGYKETKVLYNGEILTVFGMRQNIPCNQLLFPGDEVVLDDEKKKILHVLERKTILSRNHKDRARRNNVVSNKILASNIDTAVIVVSAYSPPLHPRFIDRYLMILQACGIEPIICLNKSDLKTENDERVIDIYRKLNIPVVETSAINNEGIDNLKFYLKNKRAIFVGHSGVGKSSLTNRIMDFDEIKTGHVGEKSRRGRHTTTSSKFYIWDNNSSIIDTPGIRALDVSSFNASEIQDYFPEFESYLNCKYKRCDHIHAPTEDCGVKTAVRDGDIPLSRYESYVRIMEDISVQNQKKTNSEEFNNIIF